MPNGDKFNKLDSVFEDVDIQRFIGSNSLENKALHAIITKVAGDNPTMISGLESLLTEKVLLRSFERGFCILITAESVRELHMVEAALQTTINDVRTLNDQKSPYMNDKKTSLYLYTLQNILMNLDHWKLPKNVRNNFVPSLKNKLRFAKFKSECLKISDDTLRRECYTTDYQQPYDPALRNFEFLDETRLDSYINHLRRYEITKNPRDLYSFKTITTPEIEDEKRIKVVKTLIKHMEKKFHIKEMDINYYKKNFNAINQELITLMGPKDLATLYEIINSISQYLEKEQQFKDQINHSTDKSI